MKSEVSCEALIISSVCCSLVSISIGRKSQYTKSWLLVNYRIRLALKQQTSSLLEKSGLASACDNSLVDLHKLEAGKLSTLQEDTCKMCEHLFGAIPVVCTTSQNHLCGIETDGV